jgi:O-methyltransferase
MSTFNESQRDSHNDWGYASLDDVKANFRSAGLLDDNIIFIQGDVAVTLEVPNNLPERIAALRLDTDRYESTKKELEILYPRLSIGGVLIIDDYGYWAGAREAVDEYSKGTTIVPFLSITTIPAVRASRSRNSLRSGRLLFRLPRCA